jgi:hypothetical protein
MTQHPKIENFELDRALADLQSQLDVANSYAKGENRDCVPSVWQLQNGLLGDYIQKVREAAAAGRVAWEPAFDEPKGDLIPGAEGALEASDPQICADDVKSRFYFPGGSMTVLPEFSLTIEDGRVFKFDWHRYLGPTFLKKNGDPLERQPGERHPVWNDFAIWDRQGRMTDAEGRCIYDRTLPEVRKPVEGFAELEAERMELLERAMKSMGLVAVPAKLLKDALAVMQAFSWHDGAKSINDVDDHGDLQLAATKIEASFSELAESLQAIRTMKPAVNQESKT